MGDSGGIQTMLDQLKELEILISPDMTAHASLVTTGFNLLMFDKQDPQFLDKVKVVEEFISITIEGKDDFSITRSGLELSSLPSLIQSQEDEQINQVQAKFNQMAIQRSARSSIAQKMNKMKLPPPQSKDPGLDSTASTTRFLHPNDFMTGRSQYQAYIETSTKTGSKLETPSKIAVAEVSLVTVVGNRKSMVQSQNDLSGFEFKGRWNPESNKVRSHLGKSMLYSVSSSGNRGNTFFHSLVKHVFNLGSSKTRLSELNLPRLGNQVAPRPPQHPVGLLLRSPILLREESKVLDKLPEPVGGGVPNDLQRP